MAYYNLGRRFKNLLVIVADLFRQRGWMGEVQWGLLKGMKRSEQRLFVQPSLPASPPRLVVVF